MGLFDLLFKSRADRAREKRVEKAEGDAGVQPDSTAFLVPRERTPILPVAPRNAPAERLRSGIRPASAARPIVVTLGDVIGRIPPEFLREGATNLRRELRFGTDEFLADIPRGRVTVALSNIAAQCPEMFRVPITDDDDREVRLPLQKLLDQLVGSGLAPRPQAAAVEPAPASIAPATTPAALPIQEVQEVREYAEHMASESIAAIEAEGSGRTIQLSLAAILAGCPEDLFLGERPRVDDSVQVTLPFEPIERQLTNAVVEISAQRFAALLPPPFAGCIHVREGLKIPLPLEEIFQNLPGNAGSERPPAPVGEDPAPPPPPDPPPPAPVHPAPVTPAFEAASREAFQFFSPARPHPRPVPPPPLSVRPIGEEVSHATHVEAPAAPPPAIIPPLRTSEIRPSIAEPAAFEPSPQASPPLAPQASSVPDAPGPTFQWSRPPVARPLVVLPPPLAAAAAPTPTTPVADSEAPLETSLDQAAVLEFLSGGIDAEPPK